MKHINYPKKALKFNPSGDEKAFIYQQVSELKMPVMVSMEKTKGKESSYYVATFVLDPKNLNLKVKGKGDNVFEACIQAKKRAKESFARMPSGFSSDNEREFLIELMKHKVSVH